MYENPLCVYNIALAFAYSLAALEVNAFMGKVVAAPTAGSCGVLPALLLSLDKTQGLKEEDLLRCDDLYLSGMLTQAESFNQVGQ